MTMKARFSSGRRSAAAYRGGSRSARFKENNGAIRL